MPSSGSKRRAARDLHEALDPAKPNKFSDTNDMILNFVKQSGYRSFWEIGHRLRQDMVYWVIRHRDTFVPCMRHIEAGYFNLRPEFQVEPFLEEYQLLERNNIFPVDDPVPEVARILREMSQVIQNTSSAQARLIQELEAQLVPPACPAERPEEYPEKTTRHLGAKQSLKRVIKTPQSTSKDPQSVKVTVVAGSSQCAVSQPQPPRTSGSFSLTVISGYRDQIYRLDFIDNSRDPFQTSKTIRPLITSSTTDSNEPVSTRHRLRRLIVTSSMFDDVLRKTGITANASTPRTSRGVQDASATGRSSFRQPRGRHLIESPASHRHRHAAVKQPPAKIRRLRSSMAMVTEEESLLGHPLPPTPPRRIRQSIEKDESDSSDSGDDTSSYYAETEVEVESDEDCSDGSPPSDRSNSLFLE